MKKRKINTCEGVIFISQKELSKWTDNEFTREVDIEYLQRVTAFDLTAQVQRADGVFEVITFNNIEPESINPDGDWVFNAPVTERMKAVFNIQP